MPFEISTKLPHASGNINGVKFSEPNAKGLRISERVEDEVAALFRGIEGFIVKELDALTGKKPGPDSAPADATTAPVDGANAPVDAPAAAAPAASAPASGAAK